MAEVETLLPARVDWDDLEEIDVMEELDDKLAVVEEDSEEVSEEDVESDEVQLLLLVDSLELDGTSEDEGVPISVTVTFWAALSEDVGGVSVDDVAVLVDC